MTQPILNKNDSGFHIKTDDQRFWVFPFLSNLIGDLPEDAALTLTYNSSRSKCPCHICTIPVDQLNNPNLSVDEIQLRTPKNMQYVKEHNLGQEYSIYEMENIFWKHPQFNIYSATVPDRMHHCDLGLFNYQVCFTRILIKEFCGQEGIDEFDHRLAAIPRFPELKLFKHGLGNIARFTAAEFRHMMKQLIFVVDDLILLMHKSNINRNKAKIQNEQLVDLFVSWNKMYLFSRHEKFSHSDLNEFQVF